VPGMQTTRLRRLSIALCTVLVAVCCLQASGPIRADSSEPVTVAGKVVGPDGQPVPGARVGVLQAVVIFLGLMQPLTLDSLYTTATDAGGAFTLQLWGLGPVPPAHSAWSIWARDDARALMGAVTITTAPEQPLEIRLAPASYVHTSVLDAEGKPMPGIGASVCLSKVGMNVLGPSTDEQGSVRIGPLPASLPLRIYPSANIWYLALTDDWWDEAKPEMTLTPGETRELPPLRVGVRIRAIKGTVQGEDGHPVVGASVRTFIPCAFPVSATTDADGAFALTGLLPTSADLWIMASHPTQRLHVARKIGPMTPDCRLVLRRLTSVTGQLADAQGRPVEGGQVRAVPHMRLGDRRAEEWWDVDGLPEPEVAKTDTDGLWTIEGLVSGAPYVALVNAPGISLDMWRMAFVANADDPVDLGLVMPENP